MAEYTTIKIGKATNKAVVRYKALLERLCGASLSNDVAIFLAVSTSDFQVSKETGLTACDNPIIYLNAFIQDIEQNGTEDEKKSLKNLLEDMKILSKIVLPGPKGSHVELRPIKNTSK